MGEGGSKWEVKREKGGKKVGSFELKKSHNPLQINTNVSNAPNEKIIFRKAGS